MKLSAKYTVVFFIFLMVIVYTNFYIFISMLIEVIHTSFETLEFIVDELVEHIFHTDRHTTQIITFYLLFIMSLLSIYKIYRFFIIQYNNCKNNFFDACFLFYEKTKMYWEMAPVIVKIKWCVISSICFGVLILFN